MNDELSGIMQKVIDVTENISDEDKNCKEEIEKIKNFAVDVKNTCENLKDWNLKECDPIYLENLQYKTSYYFTTQCHDSLSFYQNIEKFVNESKEIDDAISYQKENPSQEIDER